jgi:hypothetical protein
VGEILCLVVYLCLGAKKKSNKNSMAETITWKTKEKAKRCTACKKKRKRKGNLLSGKKLSHPQPPLMSLTYKS